MSTQTDPTDADRAAWSRVVLAALRGEGVEAFEALAASIDADTLAELASAEHSVAWANVPRHMVPADHRLAVLHAAARMFRYDGSAPHLDGDFFESIVASLEQRDAEWADVAAHLWRQWVMHVCETTTVWPQARSLVMRYRDLLSERPRLLGSVAAMASVCGAPVAKELWDEALAHPALGDNAARRWELELEWARCHLLLGGGEPSRAMTVLRRVRGGFGDLDTSSAQLAWTDATLELLAGLTWLGHPEDAIELLEDSLRRVQPGSELETWIRVCGAYPSALLGDTAMAMASIAAASAASTDTTLLELRAIVPARLTLAVQRGDAEEVGRLMREVARLEAGRPLDPEMRATSCVYAAEAAAAVLPVEAARDALDALDVALDAAPCRLPMHELRRDNVAAVLDGGDARSIRDRAIRLGAELPTIDRVAATSTVETRGSTPIEIRLYGEFGVLCDGEPVPESLWAGRRQARLLLAALVTRGGRLDRDAAAELLWGDIDSRTASARIAPLCNAIRSVLAHRADPAQPAPRELVTRSGSLILELAPEDGCDLFALREARRRAQHQPARSRDLAAAAITAVSARPIDDLGASAGAAEIRAELEHERSAVMPHLARAWEGRVAPEEVVDTVRRLLDRDPSDAAICATLMQLLHDRGDMAGASTAFHRTREALDAELGLAPPLDLVRLHSRLLEQDAATSEADSVAR